MKWLLLSIALSGLVLGTIACSSDSGSPEPEASVPADFVTYIDQAIVFSISYPPDWQMALSLLPDVEAIAKDFIESLAGDLSLDTAGFIFMAGLPNDEGFDPNVNVVVGTLPFDMSVDEYAEAGTQVLE